jgi:aspartyl-tRNA(Asn)/glutamyl-tRNA(Gln) amidotransferase subunit A
MPAPSESELAFLSIEQTARLLRTKKISPSELIELALTRIERLNPRINAFITVAADRARAEARKAEKLLRLGRPSNPLCGIPITIKDNFWTRGIRTTAGSPILADFIPQEDSEAVAKLKRAGAIILGKTNMHEFAYGITNENPHFGPARNPWDVDRITGGSSGGSAAALAVGIGYGATGTDTGGSIRIPSALCGVIGLKPTYGLVSVAGIIPLAKTLDHAGPMARSVSDLAIMLEVMAGDSPRAAARHTYRSLRKNRRRKFRLGWPKQYFFDRIDNEVRKAIDAAAKCFNSLGAHIEEVSLPGLERSVDPSTSIALAEATQYHESQGYFPAQAARYSDDVRHRLELGREVRAVDYLNALEVKRSVAREFDDAFEKIDAILAPTLPVPASRIGEKELVIGGEKETVRSAFVRLNRPANLTGHPALSIPCGFTRSDLDQDLPIGLQLIGPYWSEARLLSIALAFEDATDWDKRHPQLA